MTDLYRARLDAHGSTLSPASWRVARYIDANRASVLASSAMELGTRTRTSDATVVRTVQSLGFKGLAELKQALLQSLEQLPHLVDDMRRTLADVAVLHPSERIGIFGVGPSAALGSYMATLLARSGRQAMMLNATGSMLADQLLGLRAGDALLVLAYGRAYAEIVTVFDEAGRLSVPIVLVTDSLDSRFARLASVTLRAFRGRSSRVALHGATVVCLEALVLGLAAANPRTVASLERLNQLREAIRRNGSARLGAGP